MVENKIHISIVTPEENIFEGKAGFVLVPAISGAMGFLPGHIPIVARLSTGIVKIGKGDSARYFVIKSGYIEFLFNRANILRSVPWKQNMRKETESLMRLRRNTRSSRK